MKKVILAMALCVLVTGCFKTVEPETPLVRDTVSNKAEGVFKGKSIAKTRDIIIEGCVDKGWDIFVSKINHVTCSYKLDDEYSKKAYDIDDPELFIQFYTLKKGSDTRVFVQQWVSNYSAHGVKIPLREEDSVERGYRNRAQSLLLEIGAD